MLTKGIYRINDNFLAEMLYADHALLGRQLDSLIPASFRTEANYARLQQALLNYVTNAIKFSKHGTILIRTRCEPEDDEFIRVRCEVADEGIGIAPEIIPRLFGVFEQADNSPSRSE